MRHITVKIFFVLLLVVKHSEESKKYDVKEDQIHYDKGTKRESLNNTIDDVFWTESAVNSSYIPQTTEADVLISNISYGQDMFENNQNTTGPNETISDDILIQESSNSKMNVSDFESQYSKTEEKILLPRNNCNLEVYVNDNADTKLNIKFEQVNKKQSGTCCIALKSRENSALAMQIKNVHLQNENCNEETLMVVLTSWGKDFILKQYYEKQDYQPLLLTENDTVYIVLKYNITNVNSPTGYSHFYLEAFTYESKNIEFFHYIQPSSSSTTNNWFKKHDNDVGRIYFQSQQEQQQQKPSYFWNYYSFND